MTLAHERQIRPVDPPHGGGAPHDRAVRAGPGQAGRTAAAVVSYGTSSYGYDIRCSDEFKLFTDINSTIVDPKNFDPKSFVDVKGEHCIIPPNSFALARTVEYFRIPRNVLVLCLGKSTYARCGIIVNVTPARAGVGGLRHPGVLQHHAAARQDLRQRRRGAGDLPRSRSRRRLRDLLQGSRRQVPGAEWA